MNLLLKIIYWGSVAFICFNLLIALFLPTFPFEFINDRVEEFFYGLHFWGGLFAILIVGVGTIKREEGSGLAVIKIFFTMIGMVIYFCIILISVFSNLCSETTGEVLFEKKGDPSTKVVMRYFGCGAVDSTPETPYIRRIKEIAHLFIWVSDVDTSKLDKTEWKRIDNKK
jgi:hypothetical protein